MYVGQLLCVSFKDNRNSTSLPVLVDISSFGFRKMSVGVGNDIAKSAMVANAGVAVGIASLTLSAPKLFPLPVSTSGFSSTFPVPDIGRRRAVSAVTYLSRAWSQMWG